MDTIIFKKEMIIIELIKSLNNKFLTQLFPNGLTQEILLGQISLNLDYLVEVNIHIFEKPNIEVNKWGIWGKNYDVIVLKFTIHSVKELIIEHWQNVEICNLNFAMEENTYVLNFSGNNWKVSIKADTLIFQNCTTYIK
jgi:hypothetical protein